MPFAENGDVRIRYRVDGSGPPVLLHHGGGMRLESWERSGWVADLATDHTVVTFDARGHGQSTKPTDPGAYALDAMVGDVLAVADAVGHDRFHLLGWSMGGKVAWGVASMAESSLESLAIIGADPTGSDDSAGPMIELLEDGLESVVDALSQMWSVPQWVRDQYLDNDPAALLAYFRSSWPDLSDTPAALSTPTLLMCGTEDEVHDAMSDAAGQSDACAFTSLEGDDHMTALTGPDSRRRYRPFLAQHA